MTRTEISLFKEAPFFMARIPLLPSDVFHTLLRSEDVEKEIEVLYKNSPLIQEAIAVASPSLYQAMEKLSSLGEKPKKQALSSLLKYMLRMATRATPFGLFSCVATGRFGENSSMSFSTSKITKHARPDMEWIFAFLDHFFSDKEVLSYFSLRRNPLLIEGEERVTLPYSRRNEGKKEEVSIRSSPLVKQILSKSVDKIDFQALIESIIQELPDLDGEKLGDVVLALVQQDILYPTIFPSLLSATPFFDLLDTIEEKLPNHPTTKRLRTIADKIIEYNQTKVGLGKELFLEIEALMRAEADTKTLLQVDSTYNETVRLPESVAKEIRTSSSLLWSLSKRQGPPHLRSYHQNFLEKYGPFRILPVEELLDETVGLGYPDRSETEENNPDPENTLIELWADAVYSRKREILLTDEFFEKFNENAPKESAPTSFDLYCEIITNSAQNIDEGSFEVLLNPITGAGDGCSTFGRFLPILDKEIKNEVASFLKAEEAVSPFCLFAESSYFPSSARSANVAINPDLRKETLDLGFSAKKTLELKDIYIGATEKFLYLTIPRLNKQLSVVALNALNPDLAPPILRFLREVSKDSCKFLLPFDWSNAQFLPYRPRVRYKKTIFSPATWQITTSLLQLPKKTTHEEIIVKLKQWASTWSVPRYVMMTVADNKILLDLEHPLHLREVAHSLKNGSGRPVILTEKITTAGWVDTESGTHFSEFVIPLIRNYTQTEPFPIPSPQKIDSKLRFQIPGGDWVYLKLYLPTDKEASFLLDSVLPLIRDSYGNLSTWFFIRYHENERPLLRLRLKSQNETSKMVLLNKIHDWASPLIQLGSLRDLSLATYEREVERYGGEDAIEQAEEVFCADSELSLWIIDHILHKGTDLPNYAFVALSVMEILKCFDLSMEEQKQFLEDMLIDRKHLEGFRNWKDKLVSATITLFEQANTLVPETPLIKLKKSILSYQETLGAKLESKFIRSLLHMHCNRVMGIDNSLEFKSYLFALKAITIAQNKQKATLR